MKKRTLDKLRALGACREGVEYAATFDSWDDFWKHNKRGDYMFWVLGKTLTTPSLADHRKLVLCACDFARLALPFVTKGEGRPLAAIKIAEAWAAGKDGITPKDIKDAAGAATSAADADAAVNAAYAAYAARAAANAAADAAYAVNAAARAAHAAHAAAGAVAQADVIRKYFPQYPNLERITP